MSLAGTRDTLECREQSLKFLSCAPLIPPTKAVSAEILGQAIVRPRDAFVNKNLCQCLKMNCGYHFVYIQDG